MQLGKCMINIFGNLFFIAKKSTYSADNEFNNSVLRAEIKK